MIDPVWTGAGQPWPRLEKRVGVDDEDIATQMPAGTTRAPEDKLQILPDMTRSPESERQYTEALERYAPVPLRVPILVFSSIFDGRPWHEISSDFVLFELPGGHYDLVTARSRVFAAHLRDQLNRIAAQLRTAL